MDERGLDNMLDAYRVAQEAVPGIKMALAGTYHPELLDKLYDYCIGFGEAFTADELAARKAKGYKSTTYTCCSNTEPNLFSNSLSAEAAYIPVWCTANGFEGYLHWSWMNWTDSPLSDTRFRLLLQEIRILSILVLVRRCATNDLSKASLWPKRCAYCVRNINARITLRHLINSTKWSVPSNPLVFRKAAPRPKWSMPCNSW